MVLILSIIGIALAIAAWNNVHPLVGLLVGFLFVGGLGWKLIAAAVGCVISLFRPDTTEFADAWEARLGRMEFGEPSTYPPPGLYQTWRRERRLTGESAGDWLNRKALEATEAATEPTLVRHVAFYDDGLGALFELRVVNGQARWRWRYHTGVPETLDTTILTQVTISDLETELGLPLTFPHMQRKGAGQTGAETSNHAEHDVPGATAGLTEADVLGVYSRDDEVDGRA